MQSFMGAKIVFEDNRVVTKETNTQNITRPVCNSERESWMETL